MKTTAKVLFFLLMVITLSAQVKDFPKLTDGEFPGIKITREQTFDGNSLWGYINGGADIFLEYGFDKLLLQEVEINGLTFKIEFYKMIDPQSVFGIYSVSHYKCDEKSLLTKYSCLSQYQVQCAAGDYYISIINTNGSKKEQDISKEIFEKIVSKISGEDFELPEIFHNKLFEGSRDKIKYFKGILGVQNGLSEWYDYFDKFEGYEIFILPTKLFDSAVNISQIKFNSPTDINLFLSNFGADVGEPDKINTWESNGVTMFVKMINETTMVFVESTINIDKLESFTKILFE